MKSAVVLSGLLSLSGMTISSTSAMPFDLNSRDTPNTGATQQTNQNGGQPDANKPQACELRIWQHSRRSDSKEDPYFLNYQLLGAIHDGKNGKKIRSQYANGFNKVSDNNVLAITVPAAEVDSKGKVGKYGATLKIMTPALDDKKFTTEKDRDNAPLSFEFNEDKWTTETKDRCTPFSQYSAWPRKDGFKLWNQYAGEGPLGFPGKNYRMTTCSLQCVLQPDTPGITHKVAVSKTQPVKTEEHKGEHRQSASQPVKSEEHKSTNQQSSSEQQKSSTEQNGSGDKKTSDESSKSQQSSSTDETKKTN
ncbi:MAG: hypothetical protein M1835_006619 [Candelina submexicana]|nr:MAG: hypothetical protein M1835_006619 [Candelina submexicana]